ncbi:MAG: hypothetical protein WD595_01645 [Waddliaceae bacterium]
MIEDEKDDHTRMYELVMKGSYALRKTLKIDDSSYDVSVSNDEDPKTYFLHNVLNEVDKATFSILFAVDFFMKNKKESLPKKEDLQLNSKILQSKIDELSVWRRKLIEIFVDLIGFRIVNEKKYYEHYNLLYSIKSKTGSLKDKKKFYGCSNNFEKVEIQSLESRAENLGILIQSDKCWYAKKSKANEIKLSLESFESRFEQILKVAKKYQKPVLLTYRSSFGKPSEFLHPQRIWGGGVKLLNDFEHAFGSLSVLAIYVLSAIKDLLCIHNVKGPLKQIANAIKKNHFPQHVHKRRTNPFFKVGDFVITPGGLGRILKIIKSDYSYRSFIVKNLTTNQSILEKDQYIPDEISLFAPKKKIKEMTLKILHDASPGIKVSHHRLNKTLEKQIIDAWHLINSANLEK